MSLRVAIVPTPRSGNVWLRHLLERIYRVPGVAVHSVSEIDWDALPAEVILAIHWHRTAEFADQLERAGFRVLTLSRHPLDVLISILRFSLREPKTLRWLDGEGGGERSIYGAMPRSAAFLEYATGPRAKALLSISAEWWNDPATYRVRYEDLVADTAPTLRRMVDDFGVQARDSIDMAVDATSLSRMRVTTGVPYHFWLGRPGLWRKFLPPAEADTIAKAHPSIFETLGYEVDPDSALDATRADASWIEIVGQELAGELQRLTRLQRTIGQSERRLQSLSEGVATMRDRLEQVVDEPGPL